VLKEIETDIAGLLEQLNDLDDLILQFEEQEGGKRFIEAWKRARTILDLGGSHSTEETTEPATPTTTTTPQK
jgi:hypothetical protein